MNEDAKKQLFEYIDNQFAPMRPDGLGITAPEYMEHILENSGRQLTKRAARNRLDRMVQIDGWKVKMMIDYDGQRRNVYWLEE